MGIRSRIGELVVIGAEIVINFLNGLSSKAGEIISAAGNLVISAVRGIASYQGRMLTAGVQIITSFIRGIGNNAGKVVTAATDTATKFIRKVASSASRMVSTGTDFVVKMVSGIASAGGRLVTAGTDAATKFVRNVAKGLVKMIDEGEKAIIDFMNGVANALRDNQDELNAAGRNLTNAIMQGAIEGAISAAEGVISAILSPFKKAIDKVRGLNKQNSPSKVYMDIGKYMMLGAQLGIQQNSEGVVNAVASVATSMIPLGETMGYNLLAGMAKAKNPNILRDAAKKVIEGYKRAFEIQSAKTPAEADIRKFISKDFEKGLRGSADDIEKAFEGLNDKFNSAIEGARQTIQAQTSKLRELLKAKKIDYTAVARAQAVINQNQALIISASNAKKKLGELATANSANLAKAVADLDKVSEKLKTAQSDLESLKSAKASAIKQLTDQFSAVPDIDEASKNPLPKFLTDLRTRKDAVEKYRKTLETLKGLGLDNATYEKLLSEGTAGQTFADQLVAGGPAVIQEINSLDTSIQTSAGALATSAASKMHDAGIAMAAETVRGLTEQQDAAQKAVDGLVTTIVTETSNALAVQDGQSDKFKEAGIYALKGLKKGLRSKKHKDEIYAAVREIARDMINELKAELKIKSPSQVFEQLGMYTSLGMANGVTAGAQTVTSAVSSMGSDAIGTMKSSMTQLSSTLADQIDANPVITPVLDLSDVEAKAQKMNSIYTSSTIAAEASYSQAVGISKAQAAAQSVETSPADQAPREIKFEQNNYSPEALSETEIYRLTHNQLAQARRALGLTT